MSNVSCAPDPGKTHDTKQGNAGDKAKALRGQIDDSIDRLAKAIDGVRESDVFRRFLDVQAKFHRYSWHNTFLIASQRPDATQVAGYRAWQKIGRHVLKGERGIAIFAPCPWKRESQSGETESGLWFKVVHVFDVAQTDGEPLPEVDCPDIDASADALLARLESVARKRGIAIQYKAQSDLGGAFGVSHGGAVDIATGHPTGQQAKTLAHELAHEAMHKDRAIRGALTRNIAELEAESVAYVVCRHFALDTEIRSSAYIAIWDGDSKALRASLERISATARAIIDDAESSDGAGRRAVA